MFDRFSQMRPDDVFDGLRWSPILRGALLDNVLTMFMSVPLILYFAGAEAFSENKNLANRALDGAMENPAFLSSFFVVGLVITVYAAFWASQRAEHLHLRHGGWTAITSTAISFLLLLITGAADGSGPPFWYEAIGMALMVPAGVLGGWLAYLFGKPAT